MFVTERCNVSWSQVWVSWWAWQQVPSGSTLREATNDTWLSCLLSLEDAGQLTLWFLKKRKMWDSGLLWLWGVQSYQWQQSLLLRDLMSNYTGSRPKVNVVQQPVSNSSQNRCLGKSTRTCKHTWCFPTALPQASASHGPFKQTTETSRLIQGIPSFILVCLLASSCYKATSYPWPLSVFYFAYTAGEAGACFD